MAGGGAGAGRAGVLRAEVCSAHGVAHGVTRVVHGVWCGVVCSIVDDRLHLVKEVVEQVQVEYEGHAGREESSNASRARSDPLQQQSWVERATRRAFRKGRRALFGLAGSDTAGSAEAGAILGYPASRYGGSREARALLGKQEDEDMASEGNLIALLASTSAMDIKVAQRLGLLNKEHTPWESEVHDKWVPSACSHPLSVNPLVVLSHIHHCSNKPWSAFNFILGACDHTASYRSAAVLVQCTHGILRTIMCPHFPAVHLLYGG